jgi:hypothetical protein
LSDRISPRIRPAPAAHRTFIAQGWGAKNMNMIYLRNDSEIDAERCRISLGERSSLTLFALDYAGRVSWFTGFVQSIQFDPNRVVGMRWRVEMEASALPSSVGRGERKLKNK